MTTVSVKRGCYRCGAVKPRMVLCGIHGGSRGPGQPYYVCLSHVADEYANHRKLCAYCNPPKGTPARSCTIAAGLWGAMRALARLMPVQSDHVDYPHVHGSLSDCEGCQ